MSRSDVEDGSGWDGLVESAQERREREARERELRQARAQGRAEGLREAAEVCERQKMPLSNGPADRQISAQNDGCNDCAAAILALIPETKE